MKLRKKAIVAGLVGMLALPTYAEMTNVMVRTSSNKIEERTIDITSEKDVYQMRKRCEILEELLRESTKTAYLATYVPYIQNSIEENLKIQGNLSEELMRPELYIAILSRKLGAEPRKKVLIAPDASEKISFDESKCIITTTEEYQEILNNEWKGIKITPEQAKTYPSNAYVYDPWLVGSIRIDEKFLEYQGFDFSRDGMDIQSSTDIAINNLIQNRSIDKELSLISEEGVEVKFITTYKPAEGIIGEAISKYQRDSPTQEKITRAYNILCKGVDKELAKREEQEALSSLTAEDMTKTDSSEDSPETWGKRVINPEDSSLIYKR